MFCPRAADDTRSGWSVLPFRPRLCLEDIPAIYQEAIHYCVLQFYCILKENCVAFRFAKLEKENFLYDTLFNFNIKNMHYDQIAYF